MNSITEDTWKMKLEHAEAAFNRKKEIGQLLQTFVTGSADILQGILGRMEDPSVSQTTMATFVREVAMPQLEALRAYTNETFQTMSVERHMAVPLISDKWRWEPARALYKRGPPPLEPNEIIDQEAINEALPRKSIKNLKAALAARGISTDGLTEREDLEKALSASNSVAVVQEHKRALNTDEEA